MAKTKKSTKSKKSPKKLKTSVAKYKPKSNKAKKPKKACKTKKGKKKICMTKNKALRLYKFLRAIKQIPSQSMINLSQYLTKSAYDMISDATLNSICSTSVSPAMRQKIRTQLQSKKDLIRKLARKSHSIKSKRKILPQVGGSLSLIIASVLPMLMSFLKSKKII